MERSIRCLKFRIQSITPTSYGAKHANIWHLAKSPFLKSIHTEISSAIRTMVTATNHLAVQITKDRGSNEDIVHLEHVFTRIQNSLNLLGKQLFAKFILSLADEFIHWKGDGSKKEITDEFGEDSDVGKGECHFVKKEEA